MARKTGITATCTSVVCQCFILLNDKCWWLLYLAVLKISQSGKDLIWSYYWKKVGGGPYLIHLVTTSFGRNLLFCQFRQINIH